MKLDKQKTLNGGVLTLPLESATRKKIDSLLDSFGWNTDEDSPGCNVFTERAKTIEQTSKFNGYFPDYILYKTGTDIPIAVIEAKRKGQSLDSAIKKSIEKYALPLEIPIVFATDGVLFKTFHIKHNKELKIDGQTVIEFFPEKKVLRFISEGSDISEASLKVKQTREELLKIFKWTNDLLRKEGLREGIERFTEFANIIFLKLISELEEDRINNNEPRLLDAKYCWNSFADLDGTRMLEYINGVILPYLIKEYNHSDEVFESQLSIKNPKTLKIIVDKLSSLTLIDVDSDIKGDAFEYFLKNSVTIGNDLGEYFTPRHIVRLMVELINPQFGEKVNDPTCGTGGFIIEAFRHIKQSCKPTKSNLDILRQHTIYAGEITNTARIAKMNMILAGDGHTNIKRQDSLAFPVKGEYDVVLANIPYGQETDWGGLYPIPSNQADSIFIQHIIMSLNETGRAAVIVPEGFLFRGGIDKKTREYLIKHHNLQAVISLPAGIFLPYTSSKTDILIFEKSTRTKKVWFFDLEADGFELSLTRKPIPENDIGELISRWSERLQLPNDEKSWVVDVNIIEKNDFILSASRYKPRAIYNSKYPQISFSEIMTENKEVTIINDAKQYKRVTAKLHGNGVFLRDLIYGKDIKTKQQKAAKKDQFIVAEIDAKLGAFGIIPPELEGSIVSSHYFLFDLDKTKVLPQYFDYMIRFGPYEELVQPFIKGTTNYAAIRPNQVLQLKMPLPPMNVQEHIVQEIYSQLEAKNNAENTLQSLEVVGINETFFQAAKKVKLTEVAQINPKYQITQKSNEYFVEMSAINELSGKIIDFQHKTPTSGFSKFRGNDILFARITPCTENGKIALVDGLGDEVGIGSTEFIVISPKNVFPKWLYFFLKTPSLKRSAVYSMTGTTGRQRVSTDFFNNLEIPDIDIEEQKKIVKKLDIYIYKRRFGKTNDTI
jgi:type I restriction enzyme M protein